MANIVCVCEYLYFIEGKKKSVSLGICMHSVLELKDLLSVLSTTG